MDQAAGIPKRENIVPVTKSGTAYIWSNFGQLFRRIGLSYGANNWFACLCDDQYRVPVLPATRTDTLIKRILFHIIYPMF